MEYRSLGNSGLKVPVLSFGTATFGGDTDHFKAWGNTQAEGATRMVNLCLDAGVNLFDTANIYSLGASETILGAAIKGLRHKVLISTKATFPMSDSPLDHGSSRRHLLEACDDSLKRLGTDHIDIYHMHGFDAHTPVDETLKTLETLVQSGKVRYIACSNFSGWHLMKSLSVSERYGWSKYVGQQAYYSLLNRDFEWELMPLGIDQQVGTMVWSPLASGKLSGKYRRDRPFPADARVAQGGSPVINTEADDQRLYDIVEALDAVAEETGKSVAQIALNWLLRRPTISTIIVGARDEAQLRHNLDAAGWALTPEQVKRLDEASDILPPYPYWHQNQFPMLAARADLYGKSAQ